MTVIELKTAPEVKCLIQAAFPTYKKRRAYLSAFNGERNINSYWDGGSRSVYAIVELATMQRKALPTRTHPYFEITALGMANSESEIVRTDHVGNLYLKVLPAGFALVETGTFCGKDATAHIWLNAENMPKYLAAGGAQ